MSVQNEIDIKNMQRVGNQLGSNPAGIFSDGNGRRYYVKNLESPMHARNEWLAAKLYQLAGAPTFTYLPCADPCQIATAWQELDKKYIAHFSQQERTQAQQWFAVHAWTANWDAAGLDGDNQGVVNGQVVTLDVGGALSYRAHGDPKGKAFGVRVEEIDIMRKDPHNPYALDLFASMSGDQLSESIKLVTAIADNAIRNTIIENGGSQKLVDKMIARKEDLAKLLV